MAQRRPLGSLPGSGAPWGKNEHSENIPTSDGPSGDRSGQMPFAGTVSLLESIPVELSPASLEFPVPTEILEVAAEIADGSDVPGIESSRLQYLVRLLIWSARRRPARP